MLVGDLNTSITATGIDTGRVGRFCFPYGSIQYDPGTEPEGFRSNRELVSELIDAARLCVANTFFQKPLAKKVSYVDQTRVTKRLWDHTQIEQYRELDHLLVSESLLTFRN